MTNKRYYSIDEIIDAVIKALEQEPREITLDDVKGYCMPRNLTIITNELLYELTHCCGVKMAESEEEE